MATVNFLDVRIDRKTYPTPGSGGELVALENMRFTLPEGEFACLVGPSGCGKTTLLQIVAGLDTKLQGRVRIDGAPPEASPPIGYMFQSPRLMPWLTVIDNVNLVATKEARRAGAPRKILSEMGLDEFVDTYPNRLSGGMQRRAALARAFVNEPALLLLDEPFVSLDAPVALRLRNLLIDIWRARKASVLFVTHDLREALFLADRILFISANPGRIVLDQRVEVARPRQYESPELEALRAKILSEHPDLLAGLPDFGARPDDDTNAEAAMAMNNRAP
jgi:NitT/TauT family transport system ATP-binding protein